MIGYRLSEPSFYYTVAVTDLVALRIELDNYIPGVDFQDPRLPADLNAGQRPIKLLVEAYSQNGKNDVWAFGGSYAFGFDWATSCTAVPSRRCGWRRRRWWPSAAEESIRPGLSR
jgi:hypothetical protein